MSELNKKIQEAEEWINNFKKANEAYPQISNIYDELLQYKGLLDEVPEPESELRLKMEANLLKPATLFVNSLGPKPEVDSDTLNYSEISISTGATSSLAEVNVYVPDDKDWYEGFKSNTYKLMHEIDSKKHIIERTKEILTDLNHPIAKEFDELVDLYNTNKTAVGFTSSFGIKMRNVLEHFKGICNKAALIERDGEYKKQKKISWNKIAPLISIDGPNSRHANDFYKLTNVFIKIWESLSEDAKDYTVEDLGKLPETFYSTVKFLGSALQHIDLNKLQKAI